MTRSCFLCMLVVIAILAWTSRSDAQTDDSRLGIQGEYLGQVESGDRMARMGVQLIARADDEFEMTVLAGGLPGKGWQPEMDFDPGNTAKLADGKIVFTRNHQKFLVADGVIAVLEDDKPIGELKRIERKSETLGKQPPEGGLVLFDGSSGEHFEAQDGGEPVVDGLLRPGIISKQKFDGDLELHIEFRLPFEPAKSGQGRGNSGIYLQGRYEVQMLDSFGLTGEHNECGGIYSVKKPDVNMCLPPGSWQTYDIRFASAKWDGDKKTANARMTVHHNGVLIHDNVEVPNTTTAAPVKESAEPGYLYLQDHGSPVRYRNIWVVRK